MLNRNVTGVSNTIACVCRRGVEAGFSQLVNGRVCLCTLVGYLDVGPGVGTRHMEIPEEIQMYRSDSTHMYYRTVYELHMCISLSYRFKSGLTAFVFAFNMFFLSQKRQEDDVNNTETSNLDRFEQIYSTGPVRVQPVPWKMRLEMVIGMKNEILIGIRKLLY